MKKILSVVIMVCLLMISICAYAENTIDIGEVGVSNKSVTVSFTVAGLSETDQVTILVYKKNSEDSVPDSSNIVFIDQINNTNNKIIFNLLENAADGNYCVLMGGTGIQQADVGEFTLKSIIYGDVNGDKIVNLDDAVWILKFSTGTALSPTITISNGDVNADNVVNLDDAVWILKFSTGVEMPENIRINK